MILPSSGTGPAQTSNLKESRLSRLSGSECGFQTKIGKKAEIFEKRLSMGYGVPPLFTQK